MPESNDITNKFETIVNLVLPLLTIILPTAWSVISSVINSVKSKGWLSSPKCKGNYFYLWILVFSLITSFIIFCITNIVKSLTSLFIDSTVINKLIYYILSCMLYIAICNKLLNLKSVKLKLLDRRTSDIIIIILPLLILMCMFNVFNEYEWISYILYIPILIIEFLGLIRFSDTYFIYPYTYANINLSDGSCIKQIYVDKIKCKNAWVTIRMNDKEIRMKIDTIIKVEYYGEKIIKLKSTLKKYS